MVETSVPDMIDDQRDEFVFSQGLILLLLAILDDLVYRDFDVVETTTD